MKIIVAGSREFNDYNLLTNELNSILKDIDDIEIVSGGARGADRLGERYAKENGLKLKVFPADWVTYGKRAGYLRNVQMAEYSKDNGMLVAFWNGVSKGSKHMINIAERIGMKVNVIRF